MVKYYGISNRFKLFALIGLLVVAIDQITKYLVVGIAQKEIIPGFLWLTFAKNTGSAFSILQNGAIILGIISLVFTVFVAMWQLYKPSVLNERIAWALIAGGALGNAIDRLVFGYVVDFIDLGWWPIFNIADSALVIGVILLIIFEVYKKKSKANQL